MKHNQPIVRSYLHGTALGTNPHNKLILVVTQKATQLTSLTFDWLLKTNPPIKCHDS